MLMVDGDKFCHQMCLRGPPPKKNQKNTCNDPFTFVACDESIRRRS